jgi:predicted RNA methylase
MTKLEDQLDRIYNEMEGSDAALAYSDRHGIASAAILTVLDDQIADLMADYLIDRIFGKTVVEIGGGIGLLSLHMGLVAERVFCIEANPMWSWTFAEILLARKPRNVSYLFGAADEFVGLIKADVAVICTHSDVSGMKLKAAQFAPVVIDVYGELIASNPGRFDALARALRAAS